MKRYQWYSIVLLAIILIVVSSTAACTKPTPAAFEVVSLNITPADVEVGETINVAAEIRNTGGSTGVYTATLNVDGAQADTESITVAPGAAETIIFSLVKDKAGIYKVTIGEISSSLTVKEKKQPMVPKIAFTSNRDGNHAAYIMNVDGSNQVCITDNPAADIVLAWSP